MRRAYDPNNPPRERKLSAAELREMIARCFQNMDDRQLMILIDNGFDPLDVLDRSRFELRRLPEGEFELVDYEPYKTTLRGFEMFSD
jgi:hypothetical protein